MAATISESASFCRHYLTNAKSKALDEAVTEFLMEVKRFQDRVWAKDPAKVCQFDTDLSSVTFEDLETKIFAGSDKTTAGLWFSRVPPANRARKRQMSHIGDKHRTCPCHRQLIITFISYILICILTKLVILGGLDEQMESMIAKCNEKDIPVVSSLNRNSLGRALKKTCVSCVVVLNFQGAEVS